MVKSGWTKPWIFHFYFPKKRGCFPQVSEKKPHHCHATPLKSWNDLPVRTEGAGRSCEQLRLKTRFFWENRGRWRKMAWWEAFHFDSFFVWNLWCFMPIISKLCLFVLWFQCSTNSSTRFAPDLGGFLTQWDCQKHPDALIAASNLAALLQEDGKYAESVEA